MNLDLDVILDAAKPWDFTVTAGGRHYTTRRPTVGDLAAFSAVREQPGRMAPLVAALFTGEPPDVAAWTTDRLLAFTTGYLAYFEATNEAGKTSAAAVTAATAAVAAAMRPGAGT